MFTKSEIKAGPASDKERTSGSCMAKAKILETG